MGDHAPLGGRIRKCMRPRGVILARLLRCGHCGGRCMWPMAVREGAIFCEGALVNHGTERCISFGGLRVDHAVGTEVLRVLKPLGIDAAVKLDTQAGETSAAKRRLELALQRARFEAAHARRQYDAVDPTNRLVAGELERSPPRPSVRRRARSIGSASRRLPSGPACPRMNPRQLSEVLPGTVDKLTPRGRLPTLAELAE